MKKFLGILLLIGCTAGYPSVGSAHSWDLPYLPSTERGLTVQPCRSVYLHVLEAWWSTWHLCLTVRTNEHLEEEDCTNALEGYRIAWEDYEICRGTRL